MSRLHYGGRSGGPAASRERAVGVASWWSVESRSRLTSSLKRSPNKLCINVWGDAAIGFTGMDFETAVRERIPILSILLNNSSMAIERLIMKVATAKCRSTDISGRYADLARALGGYGERVAAPGDIIPALTRAIQRTQEGTPALLEFITAQELTVFHVHVTKCRLRYRPTTILPFRCKNPAAHPPYRDPTS